MMNEEVVLEQPADNFLALRDKYNPDLIKTQFKTQMVGGFNQEEVTRYIKQIREEYKSFERGMRTEINELLASRVEIEKAMENAEQLRSSYDKACYDLQVYSAECREKDSEIGELQAQLCQITDHREELKNLLAEAGQEISRLMEEAAGFEEEKNLMKLKISEYEKSMASADDLEDRNGTLADLLSDRDAELEELRRMNAEMLEELKQEKAKSLNSEICGFKDEFASLYSRIESITVEQEKMNGELQKKLDEQLSVNSELQQRLDEQAMLNSELQGRFEEERQRAVEAESDQAALMRCVAELKGSLFSEQKHLENQISMLSERRSEISSCLESLQEIL